MPCTPLFFLVLLGLVKRYLWVPLVRALQFLVWLYCFGWISPGLWFCDRLEIESKSSRFRCLSPRRLVASNLGRYKAIYPLFAAKLSLFLNLLSWRSGHPCADSYRHLSCGNQSYRCHGRFVYHPLIYHLFTIYCCFHPSHIFVLPYPIVHWKAIQKNPIAFCWYWLSCVVCTHLVACYSPSLFFHRTLVNFFPTHPPHILSCVCWKKRKKREREIRKKEL